MEEIIKHCVGYVTMLLHTGKYNYDIDEIENGKLISKREFKNLIVNRSSAILSAAVLPKSGATITHLALGIGNGDGLMPIEDISATKLINEIIRVKIDRYGLIDQNGNQVKIDNIDSVCGAVLKATISGYNNYDFVEMGLFGGPNADYTNNGIMFNYKAFSNWSIPEEASLTIIWKLYFGQKNN